MTRSKVSLDTGHVAVALLTGRKRSARVARAAGRGAAGDTGISKAAGQWASQLCRPGWPRVALQQCQARRRFGRVWAGADAEAV